MTDQPLLRVHDLRKSFGALEVLRGVSFDVSAGERVAIIGPSGSGKSTCLRAINHLEPPTQGTIELEGVPIGRTGPADRTRAMSDAELAPQRAQMGMVFQLFHLWPHLCVRDNVALQPIKVAKMPRREALALADAMLAKVHLSEKADEYPERLSGGQQQRVAIARALAQRPKLLLFDEPTSALDPELVGEVLGVIRELAAEKRAMLLVTHEIRFAREVADRVIFMDGGVIVEQGHPAEVLARPQTDRLRQFLAQMHSQT
jgi:polar amino acid transport system ATP-binding protein